MSFYNDTDLDVELRTLLDAGATLRAEWAALKFEIALRRVVAAEAKYNPNWRNQPRAAAGRFDGGQWVEGGGSAGRSTTSWPRVGAIVIPAPTSASEEQSGKLPLGLLGRVGGIISLALPLPGDTPQPKVNTYAVPGATDLVLVHIDRRATRSQSAYFARIISAGGKKPFTPFGIETPLSLDRPAVTRRLDVAVAIVDGEARFDPNALAYAYGSDIPGVTSATKPPKPKPFSTAPGSGVETQNEAEVNLAAAMRAQGRSSAEIQAAIESARTPKLVKRPLSANIPTRSRSYKIGDNEIILIPAGWKHGPYDVEFVIRRDYGTSDRSSGVRRAQEMARSAGRPDDEGFHTAAHRFFPGFKEPILPGNKKLNRGAWRTIENRIGAHAKMGREVRGRIKLQPKGAMRPDAFEIEFRAINKDGGIEEVFTKIIPNEASE